MLISGVTLLPLTGCHIDMWVQPKVHKPLQESDFFADGSSARGLVKGTVARQASGKALKVGNVFFTGVGSDGKLVDELPADVPLSKANLVRGQELYEAFCLPCHGRAGDGKGMIAIRGLALRKQPGNFNTPKLRKMPLGHFFDVITNGFGVMYSYSSRIEPADRWRIAAYVRVLQASQNVRGADVPMDKLRNGSSSETAAAHSEPHTEAHQ